MKRLCLLWLLLATVVWAQDSPDQILQRIAACRPDSRELDFYRLDWAPTLDKALARASAENRPVMLVVIHARYGDLYSGHC